LTNYLDIPPLLHKELRVNTSLGTDDLTPHTGQYIRILGMYVNSITVTAALTSTLRATLAFGTDHTTDVSKILWSGRQTQKENVGGVYIGPVNLCGEIDEVLRLTNATFSTGGIIVRAIIYYNFKSVYNNQF